MSPQSEIVITLKDWLTTFQFRQMEMIRTIQFLSLNGPSLKVKAVKQQMV